VTISLECIFNYLLDDDDARRMLVEDPSSTDNLIEELLRWETPVQTVTRRATTDLQIGDYTIKKDQQVMIGLASANTDPQGLPEAAQVDVRRGDVRNFAFGGGNHRCLGSHLARMELRTVVRTWHDRIPEYRLAPGADRIWNSSTLRGLDSLPLVWDV
jgi:cytochrome P450